MPEQTLRDFLDQHLPQAARVRRLVVGLSGGLDSTVLLHALARVGAERGVPLRAIHVHHGLSPDADAWTKQVAGLCDMLRVPLEVHRVQVAAEASLEGAARSARYAAMAASLQADEALLLAQHRDDQAETVLFRLLRGAGVTGLGAMQGHRLLPIGAGHFVPQWRPFLVLPRAHLLAYAQAQGLAWIDDESNTDCRYDRNYLRHEILPRLEARWPAVVDTLAATASRMQEAELLLQEFAADLADGSVDASGRLAVPALQSLALPRRRLVLRYWLQQQGFPLPGAAVLERILDDVAGARVDACPQVGWPGCAVRRYREHLYAMKPLQPLPEGWERRWSGELPLPLPDGQQLLLEGEPGGAWTVRYRRGGERFRLAPERPSRELRTLLQEFGVPPWLRDRLPLIFAGNELVAVAGVDLPSSDLRRRFILTHAPGDVPRATDQ